MKGRGGAYLLLHHLIQGLVLMALQLCLVIVPLVKTLEGQSIPIRKEGEGGGRGEGEGTVTPIVHMYMYNHTNNFKCPAKLHLR